jgi:kynurenine 3-monooxygenase
VFSLTAIIAVRVPPYDPILTQFSLLWGAPDSMARSGYWLAFVRFDIIRVCYRCASLPHQRSPAISRLVAEMTNRSSESVIVVGGGLTGSLISICLARRGFDVTVLERNPDPRSAPEEIQRPSINLTLCHRGLSALEQTGVMDSIAPLLTPVYGRLVHLSDGSRSYQPYGKPDQAIQSIKRKDLNVALLDVADQLGVSLRFGLRCTDIDPERRLLRLEKAGNSQFVAFSCVIAADGAFSSVRLRLQQLSRLEQSLQYSATRYKTLDIPASQHEPTLGASTVHVWPRGDFMAIAFPNSDGSHSVAFHLPVSGAQSFEQFSDAASVRDFLSAAFPDLAPLLANREHAFLSQRPSSMQTVRCSPWGHGDQILLLGDAAHAILPHYGQGANAGFEDVAMLAELLDQHGAEWKMVFAQFEDVRKPDMEAISDLCCEQAQNLHYEVDKPGFELRIRIERRLAELFPERLIPLYAMIAFTRMPYAEVRARDRRQRRIIEDLASRTAIEEMLEDPRFAEGIRPRIERDLPSTDGATPCRQRSSKDNRNVSS